MNYYNENDPKAAAWLRELIAQGLIPNGHVDDRSILEVEPKDLDGFTQHHFFAGIGGWPLALQLAGWPTTRPVWTASCPCQPFSAAGRGLGTKDPRHLWPALAALIAECRPAIAIGEQVASKAGRSWLAGIRADLEGMGCGFGAADLCAASAGEDGEGWVVRGDKAGWERVRISAPHIRQRLFWLAHANLPDKHGRASGGQQPIHEQGAGARGVGESNGSGRIKGRNASSPMGHRGATQPTGCTCGVGHAQLHGHPDDPLGRGSGGVGGWSKFHVIPCRDGKARRIESGIEPLVAGLPRGVVHGGDPITPELAQATGEARSTRLRGYGNAIVPQVAAEFILAFLDLESAEP